MAVLLVACPCAMGLATPVAVWGGLARLARLGIVGRSGDFLAALALADHICFDKTGTLSAERLSVRGWFFEPGWSGREAELKAFVAAAERGLHHPIARALTAEFTTDGGWKVIELRVEAGRGIEACVDGAGKVRVGEADFCGADSVGTPGKTVWVAVDGAVAARVELGEAWREGLAETLDGLRALGLELEVLSGDASAPPQIEGVAVRAGLSPDAKAARVRALVADGRAVLFAGDGVNDAAAMALADASLALSGGSELARASAMAVCAGADLRRLPEAVRVARRVVGGVRGNLRFAAGYNLAGMALAATGVLHPVVAALLMVVSSVWVGVRALRSAEALDAPLGRK
jgi:P-type E1-E2 ATPase